MPETDDLIARLSETASAVKLSPHPVTSMVRWTIVSVLYVALLMLCIGVRGDLSAQLHEPFFISEIVLLLVLIATSGLSAALLSFPDFHQKRWAVFLPFPALLAFCVLLAVEWIADQPPSPVPAHHGIECLLCILLYSILPAGSIFYLLRTQATTQAGMAGAVALLGATGIGSLALRLSEQTNSVVHLVEWHYLPMLAASLLGVWLGKQCLRW